MHMYARIHMQAYSLETENEINLVLLSTSLCSDWEEYFIVDIPDNLKSSSMNKANNTIPETGESKTQYMLNAVI